MHNELTSPGGAVAETETASVAIDAARSPFDHDRYLLHQKHFSISEKYKVFDAEQSPLLYVRRDAAVLRQALLYLGAVVAFLVVAGTGIAISIATDMVAFAIAGLALGMVASIFAAIMLAPKRHIHFYSDEKMQHEVLQVFQDQKFVLLNATYTVADEDLNFLGMCRKNYLDNLLRKRWFIYGEAGQLIAIVKEDSWVKSLMRRFGPLGGLMRTNFIILDSDGRTQLGVFNRKFTLFDKYVLDMTGDAERTLDRRIAVAQAVLLDTGERR